MKTLKTAACVAALALASACASTHSNRAGTGPAKPIDYDTSRTYDKCGSMVRPDDKLMPIDYDTRRVYDRCGAMVRSDDKLLPIDYDTGIVYDRCGGLSKDAVCSCCMKNPVK